MSGLAAFVGNASVFCVLDGNASVLVGNGSGACCCCCSCFGCDLVGNGSVGWLKFVCIGSGVKASFFDVGNASFFCVGNASCG